MRYFLIDKVTELVVGERIRGIKNVTLSEQFLHDHFPDYPIMPGALIIEAASQLAGFLLEQTFNDESAEGPLKRALLVKIDNAKFRQTAGPGDQLDIHATLESTLESAAQVKIRVMVQDTRIAHATLTFVMRAIASERVHAQRRYLYELWTRDLEPKPTLR